MKPVILFIAAILDGYIAGAGVKHWGELTQLHYKQARDLSSE